MSEPKIYTLEELRDETCRSFGGNNCNFHQCMYGCVLHKARQEAELRAKAESEQLKNNQDANY